MERPAPRALALGGQELLSAEGGVTYRDSAVSSDGHLETGHRWSDQHHLDCFKYS